MRLQKIDRTGKPAIEAAHPAIRVLLGVDLPFESEGAGSSPGDGDTTWLRYVLEHGWLAEVAGMPPAAAAILAARVALLAAAVLERRDIGQDGHWLLHDTEIDTARLLALAGMLAGDAGSAGQVVDTVRRLWTLALPVERLLAGGGDERLALDPASGLNRYSCAPWPRPEVVAFGSCTASSVSEAAFAAAERARRDLLEAATAAGVDHAVARATDRVAEALLDHYGSGELAHAILTASGTDAALVVTALIAAGQPGRSLVSLLVSPSETGSGVPDAVQLRHFAASTPSGEPVEKSALLDGFEDAARLVTIALRDPSGQPIEPGAVAQSCEAAVEAALNRGAAQARPHVVLHAIDGSKTGLTAPGRDCLSRLSARFGDALSIVVDACQARIEPALVRWYLEQGFAVLVTGSKFFAAPGFCGAVLVPRARPAALPTTARLPAGLAGYAKLDGSVGSRRCPCLVLRWRAALHSMAAFGRLPVFEVGARLDRLGLATRAALMRDGRLQLIAAPRPDGLGWSDRRSVFTFAVRDGDGWMGTQALRGLHRALQDGADASAICQIGQPVQLADCGMGGLRIAFSAEQVVAGADQVLALASVVKKLGRLLDACQTDRTTRSTPPTRALA